MSAPSVALVGSATIAGGTGIGTVTGSVTAGSRLVAIFTSETSSGSHTVTDNQNAGNYTADMLSQVSFRSTTVGAASKANGFTGSITVTITVGVNATGKLAVFELTNESGFDAGGGNDGDSSSSTAGGVGPTVSVTPATANCAAFGMYVSGAANATTMDSGYAAAWSPAGLNLKFHSGEYIADSGSGTETVTFGITAGSNGTWHLGLALYKGAAGPSTPNVSSTSSATPAEGSTLTITGTSFGATQGTGSVKIGADEQQVLSWADTSIQVRVCKALEKNGVALNLVVTDGAGTPSNSFALTSLQPQAGYSFTDIGTPGSTGVLPASPALASGDEVEYDNVGSLVSVATNGVPAVTPAVRQFRWRVWSASGGGWGNWALQEIELTAVLWSTSVPSGNDVWLRVPDATAGASNQTATLGGTDERERAGALTAAGGAVSLALGGRAEAEQAGALSVAVVVTLALGGQAEAAGPGGLAVAPGAAPLALGGAQERETTGGLQAQAGVVSLALGSAAEAERAGGLAAVAGAQALALGGNLEAERAGGAAIAAGAVQVQLGGQAERELAGGLAMAAGAQTVALGGQAETERAGGLTTTPGTAALQLGGQAESERTGGHQVLAGVVGLALGGAAEREVAGGASVAIGTVTLGLGGTAETERSGGHQVVPGVVGIALGGVAEREVAGGASVAIGTTVLALGGLAAGERAGGLQLAPGAVSLGLGGYFARETAGGVAVGNFTTEPVAPHRIYVLPRRDYVYTLPPREYIYTLE